ncbi:transglycosylase SLT domain-containing protein [Aquincola sp. S2]|uniref:Transglycosylase SLT domain-containing protein n=1 Tax=Pseudaquabacterium terrae TaxID=2732868 RepID=A0ABX2EGT5_9BURK|nr:transglycosylase SLT domain-containing protein [Aquabacterium terrae]NRF67833.1 transglycosylase SLT domain-containing protein [Aquabacterium terrae]
MSMMEMMLAAMQFQQASQGGGLQDLKGQINNNLQDGSNQVGGDPSSIGGPSGVGGPSGTDPMGGGGGIMQMLQQLLMMLMMVMQQMSQGGEGGGGFSPNGNSSGPGHTLDSGSPSGSPTGGVSSSGGGTPVDSNYPSRTGPAGGQYDDAINSAAAKHGMDPEVIKCVMAKESQGDPNATSSAGAVGLMQVKPETASELLGRPVTAEELKSNPELNIEVGTMYLKKMMDEKGSLEDALGGYNQGPNADWRSIPESQNYVQEIMDALGSGSLPSW